MAGIIPWIRNRLSHFRPNRPRNLRHDYDNFVKLMAEHDFALEILNELADYDRGKGIATIPYLQNTAKKLTLSAQTVVHLLNELSDNQFADLACVCDRLVQQIRDVVTGTEEPIFTPTAVFLTQITQEMADKVGNKMASLGEVRNRIGLPVPDGFATTVCAYSQFMEYSHLDLAISKLLEAEESDEPDRLLLLEKNIKSLIRQAPLPYDLASSLKTGYEKILSGSSGRFASFRSSALGEDSESSFAGQYTSVLNVPPHGIEEAYKEVVASKYNARAIYYRRKRGYRNEDIGMPVGIIQMVPATVSGVIYTEDPNHPGSNRVTISALWGLGPLLVDGEVTPDTFVVEKQEKLVIVEKQTATKRVMLVPAPEGGIQKTRVPEDKRDVPCLTDEQLQQLLLWALQIENHFRWPQDIEWAIDPDGRIFILQTRPLSLVESVIPSLPDLTDHDLLLEGGQTACGGAGAGPVYRVRTEEDLAGCPKGAVLVTHRTSARLVKVMDRVNAIVTNVGSLTDHMASLSREFHVPTLVNTKTATKKLHEGHWAIVDASNKKVYKAAWGEMAGWCPLEKQPLLNIKSTQSHRILRRLVSLVVPLKLCDPESPDFRANRCQTLHDVIRFAHEMAIRAMHDKAMNLGRFGRHHQAFLMESPLPLRVYIIDLDHVVRRGKDSKTTIAPQDVESPLFKAFWEGLADERLQWNRLESSSLDLKGFFSAMSQAMAEMSLTQQDMGANYIILAEDYLNANFRFGYHFTTVDAYVSHHAEDNHISFTFKGGAAPLERRTRRVELIRTILSRLGFNVKTTRDFLKAQTKHAPARECLEKLSQLGSLIGSTRLLDMALVNDELVEKCAQRFLSGDYCLGVICGQDSAPSTSR
ncbi:pyruvate, water dikinase [Desulfacinum hydrothermale DSM 13146]|uniref:Phosphoenolpyruvate synthase n=1 Tax=Desulfacinum hydrothermale DSM 13146 TaxID=1121390 RepID=A0A1W1XPH4_9BACT|nr:PEP/pyruvate-binding domain-containing protein [Desulfacinum hydrothermale]SMC25421.1 pyruvate, water dikinase [Desulfacinum hydrothermale DSM 13146]